MGEGGIFHIDPKILFYQSINFLFLLFILHFLLFKPLGKILAKRREDIKKDIEEAQKMRKEAEEEKKIAIQYRKEIEEEKERIIEAARKEAEKRKEEIINSAKEEANRRIKEAEEEIKNYKIKAKEELKRETIELAYILLKTVLKNWLSTKDYEKLRKEFTASQIKNLPPSI